MRRIRRIALSLALTGGLTSAGLIVAAPSASAKITPVDVSCENNGGQQPGGQQPTCTGGGLDQNSENQNPAGHAPGGHN
jgi:hypothetical protein